MPSDTEWPRGRHSAVRLDNSIIIFGGFGETRKLYPTREIWMYNLYIEEWRKHVIPNTSAAPEPFNAAIAEVINGTIYTFGGMDTYDHTRRNALCTLNKTKQGSFTWINKVLCKEESPSPRNLHAGWEYAGKLWTFGGWGSSPEGYLNEHGSFSSYSLYGRIVMRNNQLLCYDPTTQKWANLQSFGSVPSPRSAHACATIKQKVWLFGGLYDDTEWMNDFFELAMHSLTWTQIQTSQPCPNAPHDWSTLTAVTENQLVLHGGFEPLSERKCSNTWIIDLTSYSWRQYTPGRDHARCCHTGLSGLNSNAIILGGLKDGEVYNFVFHVMLEPKSLQQLAMQIIFKNQNKLPCNLLPAKLISLLGISVKSR